MKTCAFTGHRNLTDTDFDEELLKRVVCDLVKTGTTRFLSGMALGFDTIAALTVLKLKEKFKIELIACLPCATQAERFSEESKKVYDDILSRCDEIIILGQQYTHGCMHSRDRYLVENSDGLVCFLRKKTGGTYYTVKYAERMGKKIIYV